MSGTLFRLAAFTDDPSGGNPAGVWLGEALPDPAEMQRIAAEVGYSETAFIAPAEGERRIVRYYSPQAEVSFCGHATVASGVQMGQLSGAGTYLLETAVGEVMVTVNQVEGEWQASLVSVTPEFRPAEPALVEEVRELLGWQAEELDLEIPPVRAYAGAWHLVLACKTEQRLARLEYDFERLKALMLREGLTTLQLVWRESEARFHARDPFPVGGVVEDPATGAAAAALGGYLRDAGLLQAPAQLTILQGEAMGRPSRLQVDIPLSGGIVVTGQAVSLEA
ncbi:PhzF family phenazine biosynthesis isomerase [Halomonas sp. MCCC 1A17488]|uniref:PhzF family phenazine biosynthesis protein n=1 Tax=unclassified Halomonas TaxID=2609666 RepID=UPI0018D21C8E|nr:MULTISPECIES: PhzF family phenazine biosynthesis isomerase [unclassified Halomonas]MCE8016529.1 PhzF family phenazine biosynthesis isomerase [Halomonas sp. MCCC 1A17488]MCG3239862.1 PhzF family phenazine biosynthesis isomerase [Halomonas sp. MCCC 1A17488]QPP50239.1 PhzF family phenazine biosynthesis isomerase [Halomonas sp. SS10-MC5]